MERLPIDEIREAMEAGWERSRHFVLRAPTGSGKSTRVGRYLLEWKGFGETKMVWVLQPRRLAARLLAHRVAQELGEAVGERVGYAVHGEACFGKRTRLLYMTEGLGLRRLMNPESLDDVGAVILDEFHERHLDGEVVLGILKRAAETGWEGRIGVMSATIETNQLQEYLVDVERFEAMGRTHPVDVRYLGQAGMGPVWESAGQAIKAAMSDGAESDVLVFLPGKRELRRTAEVLSGRSWLRGWEICQLHGELPLAEQQRLVDGGDRPRLILATNVAETSLTLPRVRTVIDSGLARVASYDARRGINTLLVERISRANAEQRRGRAGRVAPGRCYRMWSAAQEERMAAYLEPELRRLELSGIRLIVTALGELATFPWLESPPDLAWEEAGQLLELLGATSEGEITSAGWRMAHFGMHPRQSCILFAAAEVGVLSWILPALAVMEGRSVLLPLRDARLAEERESWLAEADGHSDLLREVLAYRKAEAEGFQSGFCREYGLHMGSLREIHLSVRQWERQCRAMGLDLADEALSAASFGRAILRGYVDHIGVRIDRGTLRYRRMNGKVGLMRRESVVDKAEYIVTADTLEQEVAGGVTTMLGLNTAISPDWLRDQSGHVFREENEVILRTDTRRVEQVRRTRFGSLVLREVPGGEPDPAMAAACLARAVIDEKWILKKWDAAIENWIQRLNTLVHWCPEFELSALEEADRLLIIEQVCEGAISYKDIKDREIRPIVHQWVPEAMLPLIDQYAPERFALPDGRMVKLRYESPQKVVLSARIQQLYDVDGKQLRICDGRCALLVELLAPNQRPVHITADLNAFWAGQYPQIRKELFGRYPKHEWR